MDDTENLIAELVAVVRRYDPSKIAALETIFRRVIDRVRFPEASPVERLR